MVSSAELMVDREDVSSLKSTKQQARESHVIFLEIKTFVLV